VTLLALAVAGRGLVDPDEPAVHADDEAVLRGRAAFETLRVYDGVPFKLESHLVRLAGSCERIGLEPPDAEEARDLASLALGHAGEPNAVLRYYRTSGREQAGSPRLLVLVSSLPVHLEALRSRGIRLVSLLGVHAEVPWLLGGVKSTSYAVNMAAEAEARARGADDAVFVTEDERVLEGPVTNVWWRRGSELFTPSLDLGVLAGVTRDTLLELAPAHGFVVREGRFPVAEMRAAEEAFTSSSVRELMPVVELDGQSLGRGSASDVLQEALRATAATVGR
jgi:4-amino-4-deoxychorismate lyase